MSGLSGIAESPIGIASVDDPISGGPAGVTDAIGVARA
jgi:hypothetical protein